MVEPKDGIECRYWDVAHMAESKLFETNVFVVCTHCFFIHVKSACSILHVSTVSTRSHPNNSERLIILHA